jgi:hypothetical protein
MEDCLEKNQYDDVKTDMMISFHENKKTWWKTPFKKWKCHINHVSMIHSLNLIRLYFRIF